MPSSPTRSNTPSLAESSSDVDELFLPSSSGLDFVQEFCPVGEPFSTRTVCLLAKSLHVEETLVPMSEKFGGSLAKPTVPGEGSR